MSSSVFSTMWYRVSGLKPRLSATVKVERQVNRGVTWHVLSDARRTRALRLNASAYALAARLDGQRTVGEIWDTLTATDDDNAPTQDEAIGILWRLHARHLLQTDAQADFDALFREWSRERSETTRRRLNPLALRLPLGNPSRLLKALEPLSRLLFRWPMFIVWLAIVGYAAVAAGANWQALHAHAAKWLTTPYYALLALCVYPVIKALHELGHGLAMRRWGCPVDSAGVSLLFLIPLPFVDASSAAGLPRAYQRMTVSAAGIMVELLIASVALALWLNLQPGLIRDLAFVAAFTASVSTLLVNGNPLLRFDGYYLFVDAFDLPNLATRSAQYWGGLLKRHLLRVHSTETIVPLPSERAWLVAYAPLSWLYRLVLFIALTTWVGSISFPLGCVVGAAFAVLLLLPAARALHALFFGAVVVRERGRAAAIAAAAAMAVILLFAVIPVPYATVFEGVVWLPEHARLRTESDGFVAQVVARDGARVEKGDVVLVLRNPRITAEHAQLAARIAALEPELYAASRSDAGKAAYAEQELEQVRAEIARSEERLAGLIVRAGTRGTLVLPRGDDLIGTYARKGAMLGHVLTDESLVLRVAVAEEEAPLVAARVQGIEARLAGTIERPLHAALVRDAVGATTSLPSAALSTRHGGSTLTDPDDKDALKPLSPIVLMDVLLAQRMHDRFGERAWVRFDYGATPLAQQWMRRARQVLLRQFNPAT